MPILSAHIVPHPPLIVPSVGRGEEKKIQQTIDAYHKTAETIASLAPQTIIIITPHAAMYQDYIHISPGLSAQGSLSRFNAPNEQFDIQYDQALSREIASAAAEGGIPAGGMGEKSSQLDHGTMVPLYFLNQYVKGASFVRVSISGLPYETHYRLGGCIQEAIRKTGRRTVIVASGDLSHKLTEDGPYGFAPQGPSFDQKITGIMASGNLPAFSEFGEAFCEKAAECGLRAFIIMAGALGTHAVEPKLLSYEGPFGVGYAVCQYLVTADDPYVALSRAALAHYVTTRKELPLPDGLPASLQTERAGVFVSLKKQGKLRGCIGTIEPMQQNIAQEIVANAISAGTRDPRFPPVTVSELNELTYSVDVLSPPEAIDDKACLDVNRYGVIVTNGRRRGLLLPMLEGVNTVDEQLAIALSKAGIRQAEMYSMERFEVVRHT